MWARPRLPPERALPVSVLAGNGSRIGAVATAVLDGGPVVAAGDDVGTVRVWDPVTGEHISEFTEHDELVRSLAVTEVNDRPVVVSADPYGFQIWDLESADPISDRVDAIVNDLVIVELDEGPVLVTGGLGLSVWDVATGQLRMSDLEDDSLPDGGLEVAELDGRPVLLVLHDRIDDGQSNWTAIVWDPASATEIQRYELDDLNDVPSGFSVSSVEIDGRPAIVVSSGAESDEGRMIYLDMATGERIEHTDGNPKDGVSESTRWSGRWLMTSVTSNSTGPENVRVWDATTTEKVAGYDIDIDGRETIAATAFIELDGRLFVAAAAGADVHLLGPIEV